MAAEIYVKNDEYVKYNSFNVVRVVPNGFSGNKIKDAPKVKLLAEAIADLVKRLDRDGYFDE